MAKKKIGKTSGHPDTWLPTSTDLEQQRILAEVFEAGREDDFDGVRGAYDTKWLDYLHAESTLGRAFL